MRLPQMNSRLEETIASMDDVTYSSLIIEKNTEGIQRYMYTVSGLK